MALTTRSSLEFNSSLYSLDGIEDKNQLDKNPKIIEVLNKLYLTKELKDAYIAK